MKIRFLIYVEQRNAAGFNPQHMGFLYRDVDWPTLPREGEHVVIDGDDTNVTVRRIFWGFDGTATVELTERPVTPAEAEELTKAEASWKLSARGSGFPEWNGSTRTDVLTPDEWLWIDGALEGAASERDASPEYAELRQKIKGVAAAIDPVMSGDYRMRRG